MSDLENWGEDDEDDSNYVLPAEIENGHLTSNTEGDSADSSDDENPSPTNTGEFDTDLPTAHKYLGKLNSVSGYTLYDDGEVVDLLAVYTTTMVFPGFTLPLVINSYEESIMQNFTDQKSIFVLLCANSAFDGIYNYGVTMQIYESEMRNYFVNIKAKGRQRCKLVPGREIKNLSERLKQVTVRVIAESPISSPLCDTQMLTLKQRRRFTSSKFSDILQDYKYRRYHFTQYPFPFWVYDKYEISYYVKLIHEGMADYHGEYIPKDPLQLSYWFVQNYQLSHDERLHILKLNSTLERLRLEYKFLKLERTINCNNCGILLTDPSKVFAMSKDGIQSNYVNPGGHVYETVTVISAKNFLLDGNPSRQFSWFPGYAWTVMHCKICSNHLGWKFTSDVLRPKAFYGLAKNSFKVIIHKKPSSDHDHDLWRCERNTFTNDYIHL
ncbi:unnamed protein product [Phaedon cochleariae]|uniref:Protein cereblon n=1 Tax=Phaedon cochleariae TaxID=80249 RepID=A0A9N9X155_PHACE|nr:unnamed protein product [Phaedon cochleariae]